MTVIISNLPLPISGSTNGISQEGPQMYNRLTAVTWLIWLLMVTCLARRWQRLPLFDIQRAGWRYLQPESDPADSFRQLQIASDIFSLACAIQDYTGVYCRMVCYNKIPWGSTITGNTDSHTQMSLWSTHSMRAAYAQHASSSNHFTFGQSTHLDSGCFAWCLVDNGSILWWQHPKGDKTCEVWCQMWQHVCDDFGKRSSRCTAHLRYSLPEGSDWMARLSNLLASVLDTYIKKTKHRT